MNKSSRYDVFISSTYEDLKNQRKVIKDAIEASGNFPIGMESFPASNEEQFKHIKNEITKAQIYILLIGNRYGSICQRTKISYTEMEYDFAVAQKKEVLRFILKRNKNTGSDNPKKLSAFIKKVSRDKLCKFVNNNVELTNAIHSSIKNAEDHLNKMNENVTSVSSNSTLKNAISLLDLYKEIYESKESDWGCGIDTETILCFKNILIKLERAKEESYDNNLFKKLFPNQDLNKIKFILKYNGESISEFYLVGIDETIYIPDFLAQYHFLRQYKVGTPHDKALYSISRIVSSQNRHYEEFYNETLSKVEKEIKKDSK